MPSRFYWEIVSSIDLNTADAMLFIMTARHIHFNDKETVLNDEMQLE